uniref:C2H2-type domain-containing protein n=1 Tax=viral metagenome TaxID=1070528 RepID=A0A6M3IIS4_9ZZZZ
MEQPAEFKCEECGKSFDDEKKLRGHMMHHSKNHISNKTDDMTLSMSPQPKNLTPEEAAIFQRVMSEDNDWQQIDEGDMEDFSLSTDPFSLPAEAKKKFDQKEFVFRWAERRPSRIDTLRSAMPPLRWMIVNRNTCPWINPKDIDPILGCVPRLDQMLLFKPWSWNAKVRQAKDALADGSANRGDIKSRNGMKDERAEWMAGEKYKIGRGDVVMSDEAIIDLEAGIHDDTSELGDTFEY